MKKRWLKRMAAVVSVSLVLAACGEASGTGNDAAQPAEETAAEQEDEEQPTEETVAKEAEEAGPTEASEEESDDKAGEEASSDEEAPVDYADADNWYQIPEITKDVDTFYIYPTLYDDSIEGALDFAPIDDPTMREKVEDVYQSQACVFEESTNVFVPFYRQANLSIEVEAGKEGDMETALLTKPRTDIFAALDYYFENQNEGRPFIIAGHSQGAAMTKLALKEYFKEHTDYYAQMVAAYVIGFSVTEKELEENPHLHFAEGEEDTGVIVSWNTEGKDNKDAFNLVVMDGGVCINPLNWKRDDTYASAEENKGSLVKNEDTGEYEIQDVGADAQIDPERGVVICNSDFPYIFMDDVFGPASFHNGDYALYFENLKENVAKRITAF